jgi:hypothetical protein
MDCTEEQTFIESPTEILVEEINEPKLTAHQRAQRKYQQKPEVIKKHRVSSNKHYSENKIEIQEKRKKKREEDPEYKEIYKAINREASRKYREKIKLLKAQNKI